MIATLCYNNGVTETLRITIVLNVMSQVTNFIKQILNRPYGKNGKNYCHVSIMLEVVIIQELTV
jgi:hypothetical protein